MKNPNLNACQLSDEYFQSFGTNIVPYYRGYQTQTGKNITGFTHSFQLLRGASSSDKSTNKHTAPQLQKELLREQPTEINPLSAIPVSVPRISPLKPVVDNTVKDLEITSTRYKTSEFLATPISPRSWLSEYQAREAAAAFPAAKESQPVKLYDGASGEEIEIVIRAVYKQVFGNVHLLESQRLLTAESRLKDGQLTIKEFIRELGNSDAYRSLFFDACSNIRAIELNFKHLLGRAPDSFQEISEHINILVEGGFTAEIDSYLNSSEYKQNFGQNTVPYYVSYSSQIGKNVAGYNRIFQLIKGTSSSDRSIAASIVSSKKSQLQQSLLKQAEIKQPVVFNPQGFDLAKALGFDIGSETDSRIPSISDSYIKAFRDGQPIELVAGDSVSQQKLVIEAAYKQVFGNAHLMESERFPQIESQLGSGQITVMEFVRQLAKSEGYRALFFDACTNLKAITLNFKHLLGRSPENSAEISQHIQILAERGWEAEIDSYLDSDEYNQSFGTNIVPYYRGYKTQTGKELTGFTRSFQLLPGASSSDKSIATDTYTELERNLLGDRSHPITALDYRVNTHDSHSQAQNLSNSTESRTLTPSEYPVYQAVSQTQTQAPLNGSQPITDTVELIRKVLNIS